MKYNIPSQNFVRLEEEIAKLNRRAERLGMAPISLKVVDRTTETYQIEPGLNYDASIVVCELEGEAPQLAGWTLVAIVEPVTEYENLVREIPHQVCPPEYRTTDLHCDHCLEVRRRKEVFILRNEDGTHKQVGRTCLGDFLGHEDPDSLARKAECYIAVEKLISESQEVGWGNLGKVKSVPTELYVTMVSAVIRARGYVPKSKAEEMGVQPTAWVAWDACLNPSAKHDPIEQSDNDLAKRAIAWAAAIEPNEAPNTYIHDLAVCSRQPNVISRMIGYVASLIPAYRKSQEVELRRRNNGSLHHIGKVGERSVFDLQVVYMKEIDTRYGLQTLVRFADPDGNIALWRASGRPDWLEVGRVVKVKCTVKKHDVYEATASPETHMTRVVLVEDQKCEPSPRSYGQKQLQNLSS